MKYDMSEQRIRGFERMSGEVYTHLVRALREHNRHGIKAKLSSGIKS